VDALFNRLCIRPWRWRCAHLSNSCDAAFLKGLIWNAMHTRASLQKAFNPTAMVEVNAGPVVEVDKAAESEEELLTRGWRVNEERTSERAILNYNNFYEFTTQKEGVAAAAAGFKTDGWNLVVDPFDW